MLLIIFGKECKFKPLLTSNLDIGVLKRNIIAATKPDITIEVAGDHYTVTTHTTIKNVTIAFTLGQQYEADPGTDKKAKVIFFGR